MMEQQGERIQQIQTQLNELRQLVNQADLVVERIRRVIPKSPDSWADWRLRGAQRTLDSCRADLKRLVDLAQIVMLEEHGRDRGVAYGLKRAQQ